MYLASLTSLQLGTDTLLAIALAVLLAIAGLAAVLTIRTRRRAKTLNALIRELDTIVQSGKVSPGGLHGGTGCEPLVGVIGQLLQKFESQRVGGLHALASNKLLAREMSRIYILLDSSLDGIILLDDSQSILFANKAAARYLKVKPGTETGRSANKCLRPDELVELLVSSREDDAIRGVRIVDIAPNSELGTGHLAVILSPGVDGADEPVGQFLVIRHLETLKNQENANREFIDSVTHELRTPLTSIRASVEMLIDAEETDPQARYDFYNIIYEETHRLSLLIDNLLNISMIESGTVQPDLVPTRVKRLLEEAVDVVRPQAETKQITLECDLPDRLPTIDVDKRLFGVALMNLLGNAVKYVQNGGSVRIHTLADDNEFGIQVTDSGPGIAEDELERIFEKFYRSPSAVNEQGSGVGLATSRQIIRLHGGDIRVSSRLGEGSEFTISLPRSIINTSIGD